MRIALVVLPLAGAEFALEIDLGALARVLARDLDEAVEHHHRVPLRLLALFAGLLVLPGIRGGDPQVGDRLAARGLADFRVLAQVADQESCGSAVIPLR